MQATIKIKPTNIEKLLKTMIIIYAKNEQENQHILDHFDKVKIKHKAVTMKTCDYSAIIPKNEELGLPFDITLEKEILIERKAHLDELSANFLDRKETETKAETLKRTAFNNEWIRAKESGAKLYLVIESGSFDDIDKHKYRSKYNEKAFYNTLISWRDNYGFQIDFVNKDLMGKHILRLIQLRLKHILEE